MEYRKLLVDGKQQKRSSELALELPVEPDRVAIGCKAAFMVLYQSRFGRIPTVTGEGY